jgi:hypothetical protein
MSTFFSLIRSLKAGVSVFLLMGKMGLIVLKNPGNYSGIHILKCLELINKGLK